MVRAARTPTALYMRGTDPVHHIHVTEKGDPGFIGFAWAVNNEDQLKAVSKLPGASDIESIDEPGGGRRVDWSSQTVTQSRSSTASKPCSRSASSVS